MNLSVMSLSDSSEPTAATENPMSRRFRPSVPYVNVPGLSVIELIMAIEETFEMTTTDDDAETITTVGDIKDFVASHVRRSPSTECQTQRAFYRLRGVVCEVLQVPRARDSCTGKHPSG